MRWFVYNAGGRYVSGEVAAPEWAIVGDVMALFVQAPERDALAYTRAEMVADPDRDEALRRWESGDDSALQQADDEYRSLAAAEDIIADALGE